jgi:hypothetical protein
VDVRFHWVGIEEFPPDDLGGIELPLAGDKQRLVRNTSLANE